MEQKSEFLEVGLRAAKEAEKVLLKYFNEGGLEERLKKDGSPVTKADTEAQKVIIDIIRTVFPDHEFLGEENSDVESITSKSYLWIIDPIDGTKSYVRKNPLFATQIALMHDGQIILGISNCPALGELMYAEKDLGTFLNHKPVIISKVNTIEEGAISFGNIKYFDKHGQMSNLVNLCKSTKWARGIGDFWSYHLLAQGKIDAMIEAETKIWDIAALTIIVEEAGGKMTDLTGKPIDLESSSAIATNGLIHREIESYFKQNQ
jgi:histidinol-phosphatase